ncbi:MAG TPA: ribbon-helix-helix protein, CopG family [Spirochaetota bacterium]|nr:ribbon-helix-helix protein, CopG family [Spirochaetota bacterium]HOS32372.1 ribbon-helix-helix protein, CopG family [Spirochaetota bacterium]HOS55619.1 ribbon-helix-helix protein, CopG family [Spirochaetota bacterium]HPK61664.1 ribbon-helix-helix protein, CopG family [Spirochaetota bacterium]HQF78143.1 ribbon-helix-helix protein, CopG family [Spirochaetota bacterium]
MRKILTISIDSDLKKRIDESSKYYKISRSELVKKALEKYIAIQEFRDIRENLLPYAEKVGILVDKDIYNETK